MTAQKAKESERRENAEPRTADDLLDHLDTGQRPEPGLATLRRPLKAAQPQHCGAQGCVGARKPQGWKRAGPLQEELIAPRIAKKPAIAIAAQAEAVAEAGGQKAEAATRRTVLENDEKSSRMAGLERRIDGHANQLRQFGLGL